MGIKLLMRILVLLGILTLIVQDCLADTTLVGNTNLESGADYNTAGLAEAFSYSAIATGTATKCNLYVASDNGAGTVIVGVYSNNNGHPGTLLSTGSKTNPTNGAWNAISISSVSITLGTTYWLALLGPVGNGIIRFRDWSGGSSEGSYELNLNSLPGTWTTGVTYSTSKMSAYLVETSCPIITTEPSSQTVCVGDTATFTVAASGSITGYQWQYSIDGGSTWSSVSGGNGANTNQYTIDSPTSNMNTWRYRVIVYGDTSCPNGVTRTELQP